MEQQGTRQRILDEAVTLFAKNGYDAVRVEQIAQAVGIKAPSLYKHYKSKRDIFEHILRRMERQDMEHATACTLPEGNREEMKLAYEQASGEDLLTFSRLQFCYWTQDRFASAFRRMLTVEQYHNEEMQQLYQQYLGAGPLQYVADFLGSEDDALAFYGPMHLLYSVYDQPGQTQYAMRLLDVHLARWKMRLNGKGK